METGETYYGVYNNQIQMEAQKRISNFLKDKKIDIMSHTYGSVHITPKFTINYTQRDGKLLVTLSGYYYYSRESFSSLGGGEQEYTRTMNIDELLQLIDKAYFKYCPKKSKKKITNVEDTRMTRLNKEEKWESKMVDYYASYNQTYQNTRYNYYGYNSDYEYENFSYYGYGSGYESGYRSGYRSGYSNDYTSKRTTGSTILGRGYQQLFGKKNK